MSRLSRYVSGIVKLLPKERRERIREELSATLRRKRTELEKRLGRKADDAEIDAMLASYGAPDQVAARFATANVGGSLELVERYLAAVERRLPHELPSADILAELREALTTRIDAKEGALGRPVTVEELSEVLKEFGNPDFIAYRYRKQPYLIGPEIAPYFWPVQRIAVGLMMALTLVGSVVGHLGTERPVSAVFGTIGDMLEVGLFMFGVVTLVFVTAHNWPKQGIPQGLWNPKLLPAAHIRRPKSLFDSLFSLAVDAAFILWWVGLVTFPNQMPGPSGGEIKLNFSESAWAPLHTSILILALIEAAVHLADVVYPGWSRLRSVVSTLGHAAGLVIVSLLFGAGDLVEVTAVRAAEEGAQQAEYWANQLLKLNLVFLAIAWAIAIVVETSRLSRSRRSGGGPKLAGNGSPA